MSDTPDTTDPRDVRRVYGRRQTRALSATKQSVFEETLARLEIPRAMLKAGGMTAKTLFAKPVSALWMEIGFGMGQHLRDECLAHPDTGFIGAEPFINGMASFLGLMNGQAQDNIRVHMDDAIMVVDALADGVLDGIYILNPDPWPKKRHWKRRIVSSENVARFARVLKPGGTLIMTTDIDDLADWMVTQASNHPALRWTANTPADWQTPPPGWIPTKYEEKGAAKGRQQTYLVFEKRA